MTGKSWYRMNLTALLLSGVELSMDKDDALVSKFKESSVMEQIRALLFNAESKKPTMHIDRCVLDYLDRASFRDSCSALQSELQGLMEDDPDDTGAMNDQSGQAGPMNDQDERAAIERCLMEGDIKQAIQLISAIKPELLNEDPSMLSMLLKQQFVELLRQKDVEGALCFAQEHLSQEADNPDGLDSLERICALLAFEEPETSQFGQYMDLKHRLRALSAVNTAWLRSETGKTESALLMLAKYVEWAQMSLKSTNTPFPSLESFCAMTMKKGNNK